MAALTEIFLHGGVAYGPAEEQAVTSPLEQILRSGQASGVFRAFDPTIMAALVQRAVDGFPLLLATRPDLDPTAYAAEVTTVFDLATRASGMTVSGGGARPRRPCSAWSGRWSCTTRCARPGCRCSRPCWSGHSLPVVGLVVGLLRGRARTPCRRSGASSCCWRSGCPWSAATSGSCWPGTRW